jgi:hypothetical protein
MYVDQEWVKVFVKLGSGMMRFLQLLNEINA